MNSLKKFFLHEYSILFLIIVNAVIIVIQEFGLKSRLLDFAEAFITLLFVAEMAVKIHHSGIREFFGHFLNRVDFILIAVSVPSLAALFYGNGEGAYQLNFLLTLRAFRIFKFFRLIRFFPNVSELIRSVRHALKASYVVIAGFFLLVFICSVVTCSLFKHIVPEYFNNPLNSFYSIFRLFSVEGWYEIPDLIASRSSPLVEILSKLYFGALLLGGGILGLSLVNSIFVDAMVSDNNEELERQVSRLSDKIDILTQKLEKFSREESKEQQYPRA
jgi:voltage-gated sodium channel